MRSFPGFLMLAAAAGLALSPLANAAPRPEAKAYLGIHFGAADKDGKGVVVHKLVADSPAAKGGLKMGDVIVKCDKDDITDPRALQDWVAGRQPGDKVAMTVLRDGKEHACEVTLGERPMARAPVRPDPLRAEKGAFLGVWTRDLTPEMKNDLGVAADKGAVVMELMPDSPAARAGVKVNDVVVGVNDHTVTGPQELRDAVHKIGIGKECTLKVQRGKESLELKAKLDETPARLSWLRDFEHFPEMGDGRALNLPPAIEKELQRRFEELQKQIQEQEKRAPATR